MAGRSVDDRVGVGDQKSDRVETKEKDECGIGVGGRFDMCQRRTPKYKKRPSSTPETIFDLRIAGGWKNRRSMARKSVEYNHIIMQLQP
jgi:hypothetical protein